MRLLSALGASGFCWLDGADLRFLTSRGALPVAWAQEAMTDCLERTY
jgi:hypothetical protein